jgi:hypothetical protein
MPTVRVGICEKGKADRGRERGIAEGGGGRVGLGARALEIVFRRSGPLDPSRRSDRTLAGRGRSRRRRHAGAASGRVWAQRPDPSLRRARVAPPPRSAPPGSNGSAQFRPDAAKIHNSAPLVERLRASPFQSPESGRPFAIADKSVHPPFKFESIIALFVGSPLPRWVLQPSDLRHLLAIRDQIISVAFVWATR